MAGHLGRGVYRRPSKAPQPSNTSIPNSSQRGSNSPQGGLKSLRRLLNSAAPAKPMTEDHFFGHPRHLERAAEVAAEAAWAPRKGAGKITSTYLGCLLAVFLDSGIWVPVVFIT